MPFSGMPPVQPASQPQGGMPGEAFEQPQNMAGGMPGYGPNPGQNVVTGAVAPNGMPMIQQVQLKPEAPEKDIAGLIKTIAIIVVSLIAVTFIGLFIWMSAQYNEASSDVQGQIDKAVAEAKDELTTKMTAEFVENEKYPYRVFAGPADYGQLTFEYPKTWSVYVAEAATTGGDFNAYFNPIQVDTVSKDTINALRVTIRDESFDDVTEEYKKAMDMRDSNLTVASTTVGKNGNVTANRYTGKIPDTDLNGFIVTFKIRDKTVVMQTDSVLFKDEFDKLLGTVTFNE